MTEGYEELGDKVIKVQFVCSKHLSFPKKDGHLYGSYLLGDVMVVMLDGGEEKAEIHPVYAGLTDYNAYRSEEAEWLKRLVRTKEYKSAKYRIVISHFPMVMGKE